MSDGVLPVPDVIVQHVDSLLVERIKSLASERQCSINDVLLQALRNGLSISTTAGFRESRRGTEELTVLSGHWDAEEKGAFEQALLALAQAPASQLASENNRVGTSARRPK